jgi:dTDP-glucose 4,6-dehydratase
VFLFKCIKDKSIIKHRNNEMVMKILIFGGNGWIGTQFRDVCDRAKLGGSDIEYKISQVRRVSLQTQSEIIEEVTAYMPTHVVSFLGRTHGSIGSNTYSTIDYLEQDGKLSENMRDNLVAPLLLAYICKYANVHYTYLGTGCIFHYKDEDVQKMLGYDSRQQSAASGSEIETCYKFKETDAPNFFGSSYSIVKGLTDQIMQERNCICESVLNLRIRMPIINRDHPRNFVTKITGYSKICSLPNSMTVLDEFLPYALALMQCRYVGTLNFVNPGVISHNEMLKMYRQFVNPEFEWTNFTVDEQNEILSSKRSNNYLDTAKLESIFPNVRNIQDAVQECMISYNSPSQDNKIVLSQIQCNARIMRPLNSNGDGGDDYHGATGANAGVVNKGALLQKGGEILVNAAHYAGACTRILSKTVGELYTKMLHHKPNFRGNIYTTEMRHRNVEPVVESVPVHVPVINRPVEVLSTLVDDDTTVVCITGGAGFIGSHFINFIWAKYSKLKIINLDCIYYCSNILNVNAEIREDEGGRYKFYKTDLAASQAVTEIRGILKTHAVTHVVHFAAQSHVQNSFGESLQYTRDNVMGTHNLLEAARLYGKIQRFIHVSTDEVYGESDSIGDCKTESSLLSPTNPYAATKAAAEMIAQSYYRSFKLPLIITRGNNVYGPNQYPEKLIPRFVSLLQDGKKLTVQGTGEHIRSFIHVSDVCSAFDIILSKGTTGEIYNIGGDESSDYSVMEVAKILIKEINGAAAIGDASSDVEWIEYVDDRPFNDKRYYISNDKLKQLGWNPQVDFMDGIRDLINKTKTQM